MSRDLSFNGLRKANIDRCEEVYHPVEEWSETDWACAMGGEAGEALNLVKKRRRGEAVPLERLAEEIADMVIYADLLAFRVGINLAEAIRAKFNRTSDNVGSEVKL